MTITATSQGGGQSELVSDRVDGLARALRGKLLRQGDGTYNETRSVWNGMIDRRPALIAQCLGVGDVVVCVNFAREQGLPLSVKGGGHNIAGLAVAEGALMIDMSAMRGVWIDPATRSARAQAGCLLGDLDRETQLHGLASVLGFVSTTGVAGLTLGGGFGYLTRKYGWGCDNLNAIQLVTADGRVVTASEDDNPDLFWGMRGGGGNFGVATGFDFKLHPVGPEIIGGAIAWRAEDAAEVLELYRKIANDSPPELVVAAFMRLAPPAPWIDKDVHGKPIIAFLVCHCGSIEDGQKAVAAIKSHGKPVGDVVQRRPYVQQQSLIDATQPKGRRCYWKSEFLGALEPDLIASVLEHGGRIESPHSLLLLFPLDGALNKLATDHSAVGNRDSKVVVNMAASWESADQDDKHMGWARDAHEALRAFSTGGTYVSFLGDDEGAERTKTAYRDNHERLVQVKRKWDPDNLFKINKNIEP